MPPYLPMKQRRDVKISHASLQNDNNLKSTYTERMGKIGEQKHTITSTVAVHPDLRLAFNALTPHVIALADIYDEKGPVAPEKISVIGFSLTGTENSETVTIIATRELENLKLVNITTPPQAWDDQVTPYEHADDLSLLIEECKAEVYEYLFESKHQPDLQMSLFDTPPPADPVTRDGDTPPPGAGEDEEL
jgi:hypothetical protein